MEQISNITIRDYSLLKALKSQLENARKKSVQLICARLLNNEHIERKDTCVFPTLYLYMEINRKTECPPGTRDSEIFILATSGKK